MGPQLVSSGARESFSQDFVVFPLLFPLPPVMGCTPHCATLFTGLLTGVTGKGAPSIFPLSLISVRIPYFSVKGVSSQSSSGRFTHKAGRLRRTVQPCTLRFRAFLPYSSGPFPAAHVGRSEAVWTGSRRRWWVRPSFRLSRGLRGEACSHRTERRLLVLVTLVGCREPRREAKTCRRAGSSETVLLGFMASEISAWARRVGGTCR